MSKKTTFLKLLTSRYCHQLHMIKFHQNNYSSADTLDGRNTLQKLASTASEKRGEEQISIGTDRGI